MRKGFQKLASDMLVEALVTIEIPNQKGDLEVTKLTMNNSSAKNAKQFLVSAGATDPEKNLMESYPKTYAWLSSIDQIAQIPNSVKSSIRSALINAAEVTPRDLEDLCGSQPDLANPTKKSYIEKVIINLAEIQTPGAGKATGPGEFAISFLCGKAPAQAAIYDIDDGKNYYSVKHSDAGNLEKLEWKGAAKRAIQAENAKEELRNAILAVSKRNGMAPNSALRYGALLNYAREKKILVEAWSEFILVNVFHLDPNNDYKLTAEKGAKDLYALICKLKKSTFDLNSFLIKPPDSNAGSEGVTAWGTNDVFVSPTLKPARNFTLPPALQESANRTSIASNLISELSRRDRQEVETIARQVAREVLEDELGDDFDKAVRREMIANLKDKEVESGVADVSRDFMRKFYRSLGTASSSPLDKVKV